MKRKHALNLIANQLDFLHGKFEGMRSDFTEEELSKADVILTTLEEAGMRPPFNYDEYYKQVRKFLIPDGYAWEPEDEVN